MSIVKDFGASSVCKREGLSSFDSVLKDLSTSLVAPVGQFPDHEHLVSFLHFLASPFVRRAISLE